MAENKNVTEKEEQEKAKVMIEENEFHDVPNVTDEAEIVERSGDRPHYHVSRRKKAMYFLEGLGTGIILTLGGMYIGGRFGVKTDMRRFHQAAADVASEVTGA